MSTSAASPNGFGLQIFKITGPDDCYFLIEPYPDGYTWRLRNDGLFAVKKIQPSIAAVQSFHAGKRAFREPDSCNAQIPPILELKPGHDSKSEIFVTLDGDKLQLGQLQRRGSLVWPSGDEHPEQRWLVHVKVSGLSTDWLFDVELEWTFGTKRITVTPIEHPVIENPQDRLSRFVQDKGAERSPPNPKTPSLIGQGVPWDPAALSPGQEFPRFIYHATEQPRMVCSAQEEAELGPEWSRAYIHQNYPAWRYHWTKKELVVKNAEEDGALGGGWTGSPGEFTPYRGPRPPRSDEADPLRWADSWPFPGLSAALQSRIKAQVLRAEAAFWTASDDEGAVKTALKLACNGIAKVLFDAGALTERLLKNEIPALVWDSAIAGGWYRFASERPARIFPEQLGHYYAWRDETKDWKGVFRAEMAHWTAMLMEASADVTPPLAPPEAPSSSQPSTDSQIAINEEPDALPGGTSVEQSSVETQDQPSAPGSSEVPAVTPEERLSHFMMEHPRTTYADIKYSAKVHTPEFQEWRSGDLKSTSVMSQRIEKVLNGATPLQKKPPKSRAD